MTTHEIGTEAAAISFLMGEFALRGPNPFTPGTLAHANWAKGLAVVAAAARISAG